MPSLITMTSHPTHTPFNTHIRLHTHWLFTKWFQRTVAEELNDPSQIYHTSTRNIIMPQTTASYCYTLFPQFSVFKLSYTRQTDYCSCHLINTTNHQHKPLLVIHRPLKLCTVVFKQKHCIRHYDFCTFCCRKMHCLIILRENILQKLFEQLKCLYEVIHSSGFCAAEWFTWLPEENNHCATF